MDEANLNRAQKLYDEAREVVAEEVRLKQKSSRHIVRIASILKDLYAIFQQREDPHESWCWFRGRKDSPISGSACSSFFDRSISVSERDGTTSRLAGISWTRSPSRT